MKFTTSATILCCLLPSLLSAQTEFESTAIAQLQCTQPPSPLLLLEMLESMGKIDAKAIDSMDSVSCFEIKDGVALSRMVFQSVCAFESDGAVRAKRPDLLVRAPGTAPAQRISFGTDQNIDAVTKWYSTAIGPKHLSRAIDPATDTLDARTHVTCTAWFAQ